MPFKFLKRNTNLHIVFVNSTNSVKCWLEHNSLSSKWNLCQMTCNSLCLPLFPHLPLCTGARARGHTHTHTFCIHTRSPLPTPCNNPDSYSLLLLLYKLPVSSLSVSHVIGTAWLPRLSHVTYHQIQWLLTIFVLLKLCHI